MKILHVCTQDRGGAGLCCLRIHQALMQQGIDSRVLVLKKTSDCPEVYAAGCAPGRWKRLMMRAFNKLLRIMHLKITDSNKKRAFSEKYGMFCSLPTSGYDLSGHPLVKEADILHLHWINNFVDCPSFFKKVKKPMVWTLHDENLFLGVAHYTKCGIAENALEKKYYKIKMEAVRQIKNLTIVFLSEAMRRQYAHHEMIKGRFSTVINNALDYRRFHSVERSQARAMFGIDDTAVVFCFVAISLGEKRKGLSVLSETLVRMNIPHAMILAVGNNWDNTEWSLTKIVGSISETERLSAAYSCADYFVLPSYQETFGQTLTEALACGTPVIAFPVYITNELITKKNGIRCKGFTSEDLENGITCAMQTSYDRRAIREDVIKRFAPEIIAKQYVDLYCFHFHKLQENG